VFRAWPPPPRPCGPCTGTAAARLSGQGELASCRNRGAGRPHKGGRCGCRRLGACARLRRRATVTAAFADMWGAAPELINGLHLYSASPQPQLSSDRGCNREPSRKTQSTTKEKKTRTHVDTPTTRLSLSETDLRHPRHLLRQSPVVAPATGPLRLHLVPHGVMRPLHHCRHHWLHHRAAPCPGSATAAGNASAA